MTRILTALLYTGILLGIYGLVWGSAKVMFIGVALAVSAWLVDTCRRDVMEVGE